LPERALSYDLYIFPERYDAAALAAYFEGRLHYREGGSQYENGDTGCYFTLDFHEKPEVFDDEEPRPPHIALNLNFFRPHIFALEAEPEIRSLIQHFNCRIDDPQIDGMESAYSTDGFLRAWSHGNRSAFSIMGEQSDAPPPWPMDTALVEAVWEWNHGRARLQDAKGDNIFVPKVVWTLPSQGEQPVPCITWTQGIPTVIPDRLITHIVLVRQKQPSLMKMLGFSRSKPGEREHELKLIGTESGIRLRGIERSSVNGFDIVTTPATDTVEIAALFAGPWPPAEFRIVPAEQVCGADLVALMKAS
jgi:hypothetical protein